MSDQHTIRQLALHVAPDLHVVSTSNPEPVLRSYNVVGLFDSTEDARKAVVGMEGLERDDAAIGVTVLGSEETIEPRDDDHVDPEGVTRDVAPRVLIGSIIGAVVGAAVVGVIAGLIAGSAAAIGGVLGGAAFGAAIGAVWGAFVKMGGSDAYRQTFVAPHVRDVTLVSLHTDDIGEAAAAFDRLAATAARDVVVLDRAGHEAHVSGS